MHFFNLLKLLLVLLQNKQRVNMIVIVIIIHHLVYFLLILLLVFVFDIPYPEDKASTIRRSNFLRAPVIDTRA